MHFFYLLNNKIGEKHTKDLAKQKIFTLLIILYKELGKNFL